MVRLMQGTKRFFGNFNKSGGVLYIVAPDTGIYGIYNGSTFLTHYTFSAVYLLLKVSNRGSFVQKRYFLNLPLDRLNVL